MGANPNGVSVRPPELQLRASTVNGCTTVVCSGKLTFRTTALFKDEVCRLFARSQRLLIDLAEVAFMDSSGVGILVAISSEARAAGCEMRLVNPSRQVKNLLNVTNLSTMLLAEAPF